MQVNSCSIPLPSSSPHCWPFSFLPPDPHSRGIRWPPFSLLYSCKNAAPCYVWPSWPGWSYTAWQGEDSPRSDILILGVTTQESLLHCDLINPPTSGCFWFFVTANDQWVNYTHLSPHWSFIYIFFKDNSQKYDHDMERWVLLNFNSGCQINF